MQLKCVHCPYIATSLIIKDHDAALTEISNLFSTHINKSHPDKAKELVKDHIYLSQVAMWLMVITKHSTYLDDMEAKSPEDSIKSDPLEEAFDKQVEALEELVGIEMFANRPTDLSELGDDDNDDSEDMNSEIGQHAIALEKKRDTTTFGELMEGLAVPPEGALPE